MRNFVRLRVVVMDDDFYALDRNIELISRYPLTSVCARVRKPKELLSTVANQKPDVVVLEPEYGTQDPQLQDLLGKLRAEGPSPIIVCNTRRFSADNIRLAFNAGVRGYLLKDEVGLSLAPALVRATIGFAIFTESVYGVLKDEKTLRHRKLNKIPTWNERPNLPPRFMQAFRLRIEHGLGTKMTAAQTNLSQETIEKYISEIHSLFGSTGGEDLDLNGIDLNELSREEQTYTLYTALPKIDSPSE